MENQTPQIRGWKDVQVTPELPLTALVQFMNILNQRLVEIENNTTIKDDKTGKFITLTEFYEQQAKAELEAQMAAAEAESQAEEAK